MIKLHGWIFYSCLAFSIWSLPSCKKGCTDPMALNYEVNAQKDNGECLYSSEDTVIDVTLSFSQNFDGFSVTYSEFNDLQFINQNGELLSITKLRYMVSDVWFYLPGGDSVVIDGYHLVDVADNSTLSYTLSAEWAEGEYLGIGMTFGMDEEDNISGAYADLNVASWSWPSVLGGGYHFMQLEGRFVDANTDTSNYAYHMGIAREITTTDTIFHPNYFTVVLPNSGFTLSDDINIEIKMDVSEWFKNPNVWDLNTYSTMLMPNYNAQIMMNQNGRSVFEVGSITP